MTINVCGNCAHYATCETSERKGACMAMARQIDGHWGYHPEREFNRVACGSFKAREKGEIYGVKQ